MPPGNTRTQPPAKVIERTTAQACVAIARRIEQDRLTTGDGPGSDAARQVAQFIEEELLRALASPVPTQAWKA